MVKVADIVHFLKQFSDCNVVLEGNLQQEIISPRNTTQAEVNQFTFINSKIGDRLNTTLPNVKAGLLIIESELWNTELISLIKKELTVVTVPNSKQAMMQAAKELFPQDAVSGIHPTCVIDSTVEIPSSVSISPNVVIEKDVQIGEKCIIEANVVIGKGTQIGSNVLIKSGTVIGGSGFGYVQQEDESYEHLPHYGNVIIKDEVHIGSNTCIDRGSLSDTIIEKGVKIDNLVHIAHNVHIGENSLIIACSLIAGSVKIGKNSWVAPSVTVRNAVTIGENTVIGLGSVVTGNIPSNETYLGVPAMHIDSYKKLRAIQKSTLKE